MNKMNYIVRTLSRTNRKDYENYVINRIYNELDDLEIKPTSQQFVRRTEKNYALIDLYFPQLNIGIECDEYQHEEQKDLDELRYFDILNAIKSKDEYEEIRIKVYDRNNEDNLRDIEDVNIDISSAVKRIKEKKKNIKDFIPWDMTPDIKKAEEKGSIKVNDNFIFERKDIIELFDKPGLTRRSTAKVLDHYFLWLPGLAYKLGNKIIPFNKKDKFINILSEDGQYIYEYVDDSKKIKEKEDRLRIVFLKTKDPIINGKKVFYKFAGIFKKTDKIEKIKVNGVKENFVVLEKQNYEILLNNFIKS